jgi:flagellar biosynthesis/type III secretory pathway protein FliH
MEKRQLPTYRQSTFKQVDVGHSVILDDNYMAQNQFDAMCDRKLENAEQEAHAIITSAQEQAQEILAAAREKAAQIVEQEGNQQRDAVLQQGYDEGHQAGLEKAYQEVSQNAAQEIRMAEIVLQKAYEAEQLLINQYKNQLTDLLQYLLQLILHHEMKTQPQQITGLIEKAAEQVQYNGNARILVNPETLRMLKEFSPETMAAITELHHITFHANAGCTPYEMYLETLESSFNISAESQASIYLKTVEKHIDVSAILAEETFESPPPELSESTESEPAEAEER